MVTTLRDRQKLRTKHDILAAAWTLWERDGVADTKLSAIATLAGVSEQTLYNHFPNKDALALALLDDWATLDGFIGVLADTDEALSPAQALLSLVRELEWPDAAGEARSLQIRMICSREPRLRAAYLARVAASGAVLVGALAPRAARHGVDPLRLELMVACVQATFDVVASHQPTPLVEGRWKRDLLRELDLVMGAFP